MTRKELVVVFGIAFCLTAMIFVALPTEPAYGPSIGSEGIVECVVGATKFLWKDAPEMALALVGQTGHVPWTDVDLTNWTSSCAKMAYLWLTITVVTDNIGSSIQVRKNGTDTGVYPKATVYSEEAHSGDTVQVPVIAGLDAGQVFEYTTAVDLDGEAHFSIWVLAYWE